MKLVTVDSSMIYAAGYDAPAQELEIVFNSGRIFRYTGVSREVFEGLLAAESKGQYMLSDVIDVYPYHQVRRRNKKG